MLAPILVSVLPVALTVVIHAVGTTEWMHFMRRRFIGRDGRFKSKQSLPAVIWTAVILMLLHVIEVAVWAAAYRMLTPISSLDTFEKATYFSVVTFTTLGYGDITLPEHEWRIMSGIEALNGTLLIGWTTAFLFAVVHRTWLDAARSKH